MGTLFQFLFSIGGGLLAGPWGFLGGSLLGAILFPGKLPSGPQLDDLHIQVSTYGVVVKRAWGSVRIAGNIIQATDLIEHSQTRRSGGFLFFPGPAQKVYYYTATWAVALCEGPVDSIRKIWADGKLIFDMSDGATAAERSHSQGLLDSPSRGITLHLGDSDQAADADLAALVPAGQQPGYQGLAYIIFRDYRLDNFGNRIPVITAEVITRAQTAPDTWDDISGDITIHTEARRNHGAAVGFDKIWMASGMIYSGGWIIDKNVMAASEKADGTLDWVGQSGLVTGRESPGMVYQPADGPGDEARMVILGGYDDGAGESYYDAPDPTTHESRMVVEWTEAAPSWQPTVMVGDSGGYTLGRIPFPRDSMAAAFFVAPYPWGAGIWMYGGSSSGTDRLAWTPAGDVLGDFWFRSSSGTWQALAKFDGGEEAGAGFREYGSMMVHGGNLYLGGGIAGDAVTFLRDIYRLDFAGVMPIWSVINGDILSAITGADMYLAGLASWHGRMVAMCSTGLSGTHFYFFESTDDGENWDYMNKTSGAITGSGSNYYTIAGDETDRIASGDTITIMDGSSIESHDVTGATYDSASDTTTISISDSPGLTSGMLYVDRLQGVVPISDEFRAKSVALLSYHDRLFLVGGRDASDLIQVYESATGATASDLVPVAEIIEDVCIDAGLDESEIVTSDLSDTVQGYRVSERKSARSIIEELAQYAFFDAVESEGAIKFVPRGSATARTISSGDWGAREDDREPAQVWELTRQPDHELPYRIDVNYMNPDIDYQIGTQSAQRMITEANQQKTIDLPIVMTADRAARVAAVLLYDAWAARSIVRGSLSYRYLDLEPADRIDVRIDSIDYPVRVMRISASRPGILKIEGVLEDTPEIYTADFAGSTPVVTAGSRKWLQDRAVTGVFLDIPILAADDDDAGFYFGAYPASTVAEADWLGAEIWGLDGSDWVLLGLVDTPIHRGTAGAAMADAATELAWDDSSSVTVTMDYGVPASATDSEIFAGANLIMVGSEIIQYGTATDLGGGQYQLGHFLRGRMGTTGNMTGHASGETVTWLDRDRLARISLSDAAIGQTLTLRVVGDGVAPEDGSDQALVPAGAGLRPYPPTGVDAYHYLDGIWHIIWDRQPRGRIGWSSTADFEARIDPEKYEIDLEDAAGVVLHTQSVDVINWPDGDDRYAEIPPTGFDMADGTHQYGQDEIFGGGVNTLRFTIYQISPVTGRGTGIHKEITIVI